MNENNYNSCMELEYKQKVLQMEGDLEFKRNSLNEAVDTLTKLSEKYESLYKEKQKTEKKFIKMEERIRGTEGGLQRIRHLEELLETKEEVLLKMKDQNKEMRGIDTDFQGYKVQIQTFMQAMEEKIDIFNLDVFNTFNSLMRYLNIYIYIYILDIQWSLENIHLIPNSQKL